ncbi:hypothetical protein [Burkholderia sp. BE17]|uniref:hypothetical protein n=1 Tax=Burkholderia sp. BE17 TaxID=2656644 RepID=UPI00128C5A01|nr:hypothetical protein [Burkholderia sp. BE17]MPV70219.1 hypothetical protein [Burkholderia sp. BE17]
MLDSVNVNRRGSSQSIGFGNDCQNSRRIPITGASNSLLLGPSSQKSGSLYAAFASKDIVTQALGKNLARSYKGKQLYPLIARNDEDQVLLEKFREKQVSELRGSGSKFFRTIEQFQSDHHFSYGQAREKLGADVFDKSEAASRKFLWQAEILERIEIRSNEAGQALSRLRPSHDKLYILGHGGAGMDILAADAKCLEGMVKGKDVARQLADGGLDKAFSDIRVTACYSADSRKPMSFHPEDLVRAAKPDTKRGGLFGVFGAKVATREPFAQTLSNELNRVGFAQPSVVGYHGAGVTFPPNDHHVQHLPEVDQADKRSSEVRQHFAPSAAAKIRTGNSVGGKGLREGFKKTAQKFQRVGRSVWSAISRSARFIRR